MAAVLRAWADILKFYFTYVPRFGRIHPDLPSGKLLDSIGLEDVTELRLDVAFADEFNAAYTELKAKLKAAFPDPHFGRLLSACWAVRAAQSAAAFLLGWHWGLLLGLAQFVAAPLSLTCSFIRLFTNISDCVFHYALNAAVALGCAPMLAAFPGMPKFVMGPCFIGTFFAVDFALNLFVHLRTSESFGSARFLKHVLYGSFNTKTYFLVVFGCLYGLEFDVLVVVVTSLLTRLMTKHRVFQKFLRSVGWPCFEVCFYVEHRLGHMPVVYQNAHKMHHYLHDTTAFDAHVYGSGMNEEFFWILAETLPCLLAPHLLFPYFLNFETLYVSWTNKGAHARSADGVDDNTFGCFDEDNFHADHHTLHRANFGSSTGVILDFYFGTQGAGTKGSAGLKYTLTPDAEDASKVVARIERVTGNNRAPRLPAPLDEDEEEPVVLAGGWESNSITLKELQAHSSVENGGVWVALHGAVFDLSNFLRIHPGGIPVLLAHAGTDATSTFDEIGHSSKALQMAGKRLVGRLQGAELSGFAADLLRERVSSAAAEQRTGGHQGGKGLKEPLLAA